MRIVDVAGLPERPVGTFGGEGFTISPVAGGAHVSIARLEPNGRIGRHPAPVDQWLIVLAGEARVSGADGTALGVGPGRAAVWMAGEEHETRTDRGLLAVIIEGEGLGAAPP